MAAHESTSWAARPTVPRSRLEATARARARATLAQGLVIACLAAAGSYLQSAYVRPYLGVRRMCAPQPVEEPG